MGNNAEIYLQVSREKLLQLLDIQGEEDSLDFKETIDLSTARGKAELTRDIIGLANTEGGGHIVVGRTDDTYVPVGLSEGVHLDTTVIYNAVSKYVKSDIRFVAAEYEVENQAWSASRRFGIIYVAESPTVVIPVCDLSYQDNKNTVAVVRQGEILVRRGAQTCRADQAALDRLLGSRGGTHLLEDYQLHPLDSNLPPREEITVNFVGRMQELAELWSWLRDPHRRRWLLAGAGGKGKTAIAYEFATQVEASAPEDLDYILWLSAKRRRFIEGSVEGITNPDFWDLSSLLDAILRGYGFVEYLSLPFEEKRGRVIELLRKLPALVVADDIDSLEADEEGAIDFLIDALAETTGKLLLTSRRIPFGLGGAKTQVTGLNEADSQKFIQSRIELFDLPSRLFTTRVMRDVIRVTEGSPLYMEDLLRLCRVVHINEAIKTWENKGANAAREYALKREFEQLLPTAKEIVLACCLPDGPISLAEIRDITGRSEDLIVSEMPTIQNLFLVSHPRLIEGDQRFDVNLNTRALILHIYEGSDLLRRLREAFRQVSGQQIIRGKTEIASYLRQARSLLRLRAYTDAEQLVLAALDRHPNDPDLTGQLGVIYARWRPIPRTTDARAQFERAAQLKCRREWVYCFWAEMESHEEEWTAAARAAELGISHVAPTTRLRYLAGYAHSRLGRELERGLHSDRAKKEMLLADNYLKQAIKDPERLRDSEERRLNSRVFRTLVVNCEGLHRIDEMHRLLERWQQEHPDDPYTISEAERLLAKYPKPHQSRPS